MKCFSLTGLRIRKRLSFRDNLKSLLDSKSDIVWGKIKYIDSVEKHQEGIQSNVQSHSQTAGGGDQEEDRENETEEDDEGDGDGETDKENQHSVFEMDDYLATEEELDSLKLEIIAGDKDKSEWLVVDNCH